MTVVGVTGHANLDDPTSLMVLDALTSVLTPYRSDLVGVTCLARGADQVFADVILRLGGSLEVVVPAEDYFDRIPSQKDRARCDAYLASATAVHSMPFQKAGREAYSVASRAVIERSDVIVAVWDGSAESGTGEAVAIAQELGRDVLVIWPAGSRRS
jgi:hypothetical protein